MSDKTGIEWTDATWNPVRGCSRVSEGCRNCYAERVAARFSGPGQPYDGLATMRNGEPRWTGEVREIARHMRDPLRWREPRRIFVNSMSDLFHEKLSEDAVDRVFEVMAQATQHTFQILTKRPARMLEYVRGWSGSLGPAGKWPLPNVWLGVSAENQATADERIPLLLETPAAVRFISAEPLLGPIDLRQSGDQRDVLWRRAHGGSYVRQLLDWVIVGGESGPGARPMRPEWARSLRDQCIDAGTIAFFFKQWGEYAPGLNTTRPEDQTMHRSGKKAAGRLLDGRTWDEMPRRAS